MTPVATPRAPVARRPLSTALGVLGEVLITLGVLLGLFLVWQLWWTDEVGARAQAAVVAELDWEPPTVAPSTAALPRRDDAPVIAEPAFGTTFATLQVPRWDPVERPISQGTDKSQILDALGIGHYERTAMPGGIGNFAVAGHRTTYGKPLNRVEELVLGDPLVVRTQDTWYVYRVSATQVVDPRQIEVIAPVPGDPAAVATEATMTLTTCHPMFSARERFVVHAVLDYWMPVVDGSPVELEGGA
ncbi:MAG TPA: class E sortase [Actinotalea sp.]|nr:class E sortase [Actinotalea sp.]